MLNRRFLNYRACIACVSGDRVHFRLYRTGRRMRYFGRVLYHTASVRRSGPVVFSSLDVYDPHYGRGRVGGLVASEALIITLSSIFSCAVIDTAAQDYFLTAIR